jgi:hypothetical protein
MTVGELTAVDGQSVGVGEVVRLVIPSGSDHGINAKTEWQPRVGQGPSFHGQSFEPRAIPLVVVPGLAAGGLDISAWMSTALALLRPTNALRTLSADLDGVAVTIEAVIETIATGEGPVLTARASAPSSFWRAATQSTTSLTVTNDGNAPANPTITIKPTTGTVLRRRVTFDENTGRGLVNHPIRLTVNTTSAGPIAAASDVLIFDQGNPTLFQSQNLNNASTLLDIRKSLRPSSTDEFVDVVYGTAVNNTVTANALLPWGMDLAHGSHSNTVWVYRATATTINGVAAPAIWELSRAPQIPGVWFPVRFGGTSTSDAWNESASGVQLIANAAMQLNTQVEMSASGAVNGFTLASLIGWSDLNVKYRLPEADGWLTGDATVSGGTTLSDLEVDGGVDVLLRSQLSGDTWQEQASSAPITVTLDSAKVPTLTVDGSATTMARINGRLTNTTTGDYVDIFDLYIDADASGGLVIDTLAGGVEKNRVYPSLSTSPMYSGSGGRGWAFSNPAGLPLVPGANVLAWHAVGTSGGSGDGAPTITTTWSDTFL